MTARRPSLREIRATQDLDVNVRRMLAAGHYYAWATRAHFGGVAVALLLALLSPVVLFVEPSLGPTLGAVAGAWIFVSRILLEPIKQEAQRKGAAAQELFDCAVLGTDWNDALARPLSEEEVRSASGAMAGAARARGWYAADADISWPNSVVLCQRANAVWARRQHQGYARLLAAAGGVWLIVGVVVAVAAGASLAQYLTTILLPSLPAVLDAAELSRKHSNTADERQALEDRADQLVRAGTATDQDLREIQDQLYVLRRDAPLVPGWFYKLVRTNYEADMRYAVARAAEAAPDIPSHT